MDWESIGNFNDIPAVSGLYMIRLIDPDKLSMIEVPESGIIYIGKAKNLKNRKVSQHFRVGGTGGSTLRRSLGALLKDEKGFTAEPRGNGNHDIDCRNYCFTGEDEKRLNCWMHRNLEISFCIMNDENLDAAEIIAIEAYEPVLCLTYWPNPQREFIMSKRKICADEARINWQMQVQDALPEADTND